MNHNFNLLDVGGYRVGNPKLKESLYLKKKERLELRGISFGVARNLLYDRAHSLKARWSENYSLDFLRSPNFRKVIVTPLDQWITKEQLPPWKGNLTDKREKITLSEDSKVELKFLSDIKPTAVNLGPIKRPYQDIGHIFNPSLEYLNVGKKIESRKREFRSMPSNLGEVLETNLNEQLPRSILVIPPQGFELEILPLNTTAANGNLLETIPNLVPSCEKGNKLSHRERIPVKSDPVEAKLEQLKTEIFDEDFNELEFFKIKIENVKM